MLNRLHKTTDLSSDRRTYTFKNVDGIKELEFDKGIRTLESMLDKTYTAATDVLDDKRIYIFKLAGISNKRGIEVWISNPKMDINEYQASPIEALYLKISQFECLGKTEDMIWVNDIEIDADYNVPHEFVEEMELLKDRQIDGDVKQYIDENIDSIAKYVYLKTKPTREERESISKNACKVSTVLDCCARAKRLVSPEKKPTELLIISCLQAILTDEISYEEYEFYDYKRCFKHKPMIHQVKKKPLLDAINFCWVRKTMNHWYANTGRYKVIRSLRNFENICYEILSEMYSYPNISEMLSANQDYCDQLAQNNIAI